MSDPFTSTTLLRTFSVQTPSGKKSIATWEEREEEEDVILSSKCNMKWSGSMLWATVVLLTLEEP
jgi:hypothetical protein